MYVCGHSVSTATSYGLRDQCVVQVMPGRASTIRSVYLLRGVRLKYSTTCVVHLMRALNVVSGNGVVGPCEDSGLDNENEGVGSSGLMVYRAVALYVLTSCDSETSTTGVEEVHLVPSTRMATKYVDPERVSKQGLPPSGTVHPSTRGTRVLTSPERDFI